MNAFRRQRDLPVLFRFRLRRAIAGADLTKQEHDDLLDAIYDDAFIDELGAQVIASQGAPIGGIIDWLKGLDWLRIISIALSLLLLFLEVRKEGQQ